MPPVTEGITMGPNVAKVYGHRRYSWNRFELCREWRCKETGEIVTDIQIADIDYTYNISHIPESFHGVLRSLMSKEARKRSWEQKRRSHRQLCNHPKNYREDITEFGDSVTRYCCIKCGYSEPKPKRIEPPTDIEQLTTFFAEQDELIIQWKKEAVAHKLFMKEVDELIEEVFRVTRK